MRPRQRERVLGAPIDVLGLDGALDRIARWAAQGESRVVCCCNAHSVVTARRDPAFAAAIAGADLATPDGAPVAWMLRRLGHRDQARIAGPELMWHLLERAALSATPVFLFGGSEATLARLREQLARRLPALRVAGHLSPPFTAPTAGDDLAHAERINASGARVVLVALGCPKQELWMARQRGRVGAVMLGVGAAFDFHAGALRRAPRWMQRMGLEWLHRLAAEPRRLGWRYLSTNTAFAAGAAAQLLARAFSR